MRIFLQYKHQLSLFQRSKVFISSPLLLPAEKLDFITQHLNHLWIFRLMMLVFVFSPFILGEVSALFFVSEVGDILALVVNVTPGETSSDSGSSMICTLTMP